MLLQRQCRLADAAWRQCCRSDIAGDADAVLMIMRLLKPCGYSSHAAFGTMRSIHDHAATQVMRLFKPCGLRDHAIFS